MRAYFDDLEIFCSVAHAGSLYHASRNLGIPHSTVSRRLAVLEDKLGQQLVIRTTRQMRLTEKGQALYDRSQPVLHQLKVAVSESLDDEGELSGPMKFSMPTRVGLDYMGDILIAFNKLHPKLELNIELENDNADLVKDGIDLAFRVGPLVDSSAIAAKLWEIPFRLVASEEFVDKHQIDVSNFQLKHIDSLPCTVIHPQSRWLFDDERQGQISITPTPAITFNDMTLGVKAAINGLGVAYAPDLIINRQPGNEQLRDIKGETWQPLTRSLYGFYTTNRGSSRKIRAVLDYVKEAYQQQFGD